MNELVPQPWEVWHARFNFSEGHGYKYRPVIVLATRADGSLVAMVTSATNKLSKETRSVRLHLWKSLRGYFAGVYC